MGAAISAIVSDASKKREAKIYKRVSYAAARRQFAKLSKDDSISFRKEAVWNTSPVSANFRVVPVICHWKPSLELLRLVPTNFEIDGSDIGVKQGEKNHLFEIHESRSRNYLRYILENNLYTNLYGVKISSSPHNWNFTLGLDRVQYDSLFNRSRLQSISL